VQPAGRDYGAEPSVEEVQLAVKALRNGAAGGLDGIVAPLLKTGFVVVSWLHRVICAVWRSGRAPVDWKRALIVPLYKGKGDRKVADNYRGISLLSIPGKVYATILMRRVYEQVDSQLSDAQSAFRKGRGIGDAVFTLRMTMARCKEFNVPMHMAFVDLRKAYDSVHRPTLWLILRRYGVHEKLRELLSDLHVGTQAAVKLCGQQSEFFNVECGVRQGCVIAPLLFNMFMDFMVKAALADMPNGCGVKLAYLAAGEICCGGGAGEDGHSPHVINTLLYADDLVLMSHDADELAAMLKVLDEKCAELGMCINASKTELMSAGKIEQQQQSQQSADVQLADGTAKYVEVFKYLGGLVTPCGSCEREVAARVGKALGKFKQMKEVWRNKKLRLRTKVKCYQCYVLPILLFGSEYWAMTDAQVTQLERVHSMCMRHMLRVRLSDMHSLSWLRGQCGLASMKQYLMAGRMRWLGHLLRMDDGRLPHVALFSHPVGGWRAPGRPMMRWADRLKKDLSELGLPQHRWGDDGIQVMCNDRQGWRQLVYDITHPQAG
jgi:hypothetical protein